MLALVTGNAGFIGFHTVKRLLERGDYCRCSRTMPSTFADVSLIASGVGYRLRVPVHEDAARFVQWYREYSS